MMWFNHAHIPMLVIEVHVAAFCGRFDALGNLLNSCMVVFTDSIVANESEMTKKQCWSSGTPPMVELRMTPFSMDDVLLTFQTLLPVHKEHVATTTTCCTRSKHTPTT